MIAGLTSAGDKIFGTAGDEGEKYFSAIEQTLKKIEASYQNQYRTQGTPTGQQFFVERNQLLNQLKELVNKPLVKSLARHSVKFRPYEDMRRALNLSSRSIVHEWSTAGVTGIPGYSTYVGNAAKAARFLKYGGYIGIGFAFAATTNDVAEACNKGREGECSKIAIKEYAKFATGTVAGIAGGTLGASAGMGVCVAVGIVTAGAGGVACAAVGSLIGELLPVLQTIILWMPGQNSMKNIIYYTGLAFAIAPFFILVIQFILFSINNRKYNTLLSMYHGNEF